MQRKHLTPSSLQPPCMQPWQSGLPLMLALVLRMTHCSSLADMGALLLWDVNTQLMDSDHRQPQKFHYIMSFMHLMIKILQLPDSDALSHGMWSWAIATTLAIELLQFLILAYVCTYD